MALCYLQIEGETMQTFLQVIQQKLYKTMHIWLFNYLYKTTSFFFLGYIAITNDPSRNLKWFIKTKSFCVCGFVFAFSLVSVLY